MGANIFVRIIVGAAAAVCIPPVAVFAAEELIINGGFETGDLAPWTGENASILHGGHTGRYHAGYFYNGKTHVTVTIQQQLGRTIFPQQLEKFCLWAYGGIIDPYGQHENASITVYLGNNRYDDYLFFYYLFWEYVEFPLGMLKEPFSYVKIEIRVPGFDYGPASTRAGFDDVSMQITPTPVSAASLGRVKALYK